MKFYYKGQLVRTSKTHDYKWAVVEEKDDGSLEVYACRTKREAAESEMRYWAARDHRGVRVVPLDKEQNSVVLDYEQFMELAKANYDNGGKYYVEFWRERTFNDHVKYFGVITETTAMKMFTSAQDQDED